MHVKSLLNSVWLLMAFVAGGCASSTPTQVLIIPTASATSSATSQPPSPIAVTLETDVPALPTQSTQPSCEEWRTFPVVPTLSERTHALYEEGQRLGNNPRAFSKIGDGEISTAWFFTMFDLGEPYYDLGPFTNLAPAIQHFAGSFGRIGIAARRGFNTQRILDPALSDPALCEPGESPLSCELRLHRPAFAILSLGTNQVWQPAEFEQGMRQILDVLLANHVVPILSTKGDNLEGDHRINQTIACLAREYDLPLWNFWAAIQPLPDQGLQPDLEHLTYGVTDFDDERAMQTAWTTRNLTALQALDAVWRGVSGQP